MKDLKGKVVLVTGAARGMGKLHAMTFGREGSRIVAVDLDEAAIEATAQEMRDQGYNVNVYIADVSNRSACFALADQVKSDVGSVDVLINNAGIVKAEKVLNMSEQSFRRITEVNYMGQVWMMQAFVPDMVSRKSGHVVNVSSTAGKIGVPDLGAYCATKFAIVGITDSIRQELQKNGVKFIIVCPGFIKTGMVKGAKPPSLTPWQDPQKVADAVLRAVKNNKAEIFVPPVMLRLSSVGRALAGPKIIDWILLMIGGQKAFIEMEADRGRLF